MPATVRLSKPLKTHGGEVTELTLRDLVASDLVKMRRSPTTITNMQDLTPNVAGPARRDKIEYRIEPNYDVVMDYLVLLTGLDPIVLGAMPARDFRRATDVVTGLWNDEVSDGTGEKNTPLDTKDTSTSS